MSNDGRRRRSKTGFHSVLFYTALFVLIAPILGRQLYAQDLFKALYSGRYLQWFHQFPHHSTFTFHETVDFLGRNSFNWFGNLIFYGVYVSGGYSGLQLFRNLLIVFAGAVFHAFSDWDYHPLVLIILTVGLYGLSQNLLVRTAIFAVPFTLLVLWLWEQYRFEGKNQYLWFYPVLFLFWGNMHGSYLIGFGILVLLTLGDGIDGLIGDRNLFDSIQVKYLLLLAMVLVVIVGVKPSFDNKLFTKSSDLITTITQVAGDQAENQDSSDDTYRSLPGNPSDVPLIREKIGVHRLKGHGSPELSQRTWSESLYQLVRRMLTQTLFEMNRFRSDEFEFPFSRPNLLLTRANFFVAFIGVLVFLMRPLKIRLSYLLPFLAVLVVGLGYMRTVGYISLVGIPIIFSKYRRDLKGVDFGLDNPWVLISAIVAISLLIGNVGSHLARGSIHEFTRNDGHRLGWGTIDRYEDRFAEELLRDYPGEKFFNSYGLGSFLAWKWWPHKKVFIDSKYSAYARSFKKRFIGMTLPEQLQRENIDYGVLETGNLWLVYFLHSDDWTILKRKSGMILVGRRTPG